MKSLKWLLIIAILAFLISACSSGEAETLEVPSAPDSQATQEPQGQDENEELAYPYYVKPTLKPSPTTLPYPGEGDQIALPELVNWEDAVQFILDGQVAEVSQLGSVEITLKLKDGRELATKEPEIDDVLDVIEECGDLCTDIIVITE